MELGIFLRRHLLHLECGEENAEDKDGCTDVECILHCVRNLSLRSDIRDAEPCEDEREEVTHEASGVAEEALDRVCLALLLLVHHVSHEHLERLHRNVDRCVEKHERDESEDHCSAHCKSEVSGIRKHAHHEDGDDGAEEEVWDTPSETGPCPVAVFSDERLYDQSHERRKNPEEAQVMRVCAKRCKNTADIGVLKGICDLNSEKSEADIPHLPESKFCFLHFIAILVTNFQCYKCLLK